MKKAAYPRSRSPARPTTTLNPSASRMNIPVVTRMLVPELPPGMRLRNGRSMIESFSRMSGIDAMIKARIR